MPCSEFKGLCGTTEHNFAHSQFFLLCSVEHKRKNWLFAGSPKGAAASAGIYTLVETAKANGLAPMKYLKYILADMPGSAFLEHPEYLDDYLPWNPMVKELCQ